jgi:hypothetical protein
VLPRYPIVIRRPAHGFTSDFRRARTRGGPVRSGIVAEDDNGVTASSQTLTRCGRPLMPPRFHPERAVRS